MTKQLRIFLSSPGDVKAAREIAALTIERLAQDYARFFIIEPYLWEYEAMVASGHFQDSIDPPSAFDIVVLIVWSRLGTPLPERTQLRDYRGIDGRSPVTGTEWEFEEALQAAKESGAPEILVYRSRQRANVDSWDAEARRHDFEQLEALDRFWYRHFATKGVLGAAYTEFANNDEFAVALENHLRKLIEKRINARQNQPGVKVWTQAPFRGLETYEFEHAPIFFGQDEALAKAMLQLATTADNGTPFLLVLGASGSGKSSLVKAAVVPKLFVPRRVPGAAFLRRIEFRPSDARSGEDLFDALARRLTTTGGKWEGLPELIGPGQSTAELAAHLRTASSDPVYPIGMVLGQLATQARQAGRMLDYESPKLVLVVDQLEELFASESIVLAERRRFVDLLLGLARSRLVWVLATMRKDFWHRADETPDLVRLAEGNGRLELLPPSPVQLSQMIRRPAEAASISFELHPITGIALNEAIAEEVAREPGALPLLSYLLDQLYRSDVLEALGNTLTYATYEKLGRLEGAIATMADAVLDRCIVEDRQSLGSVLFSLVQVGSQGDIDRAIARRVPLSTFADGTPQRRLVQALLDPDARLLVSDAEDNAVPTVRVAHEALITRWNRARTFIQSSLEALKVRRRIEERYVLWQHLLKKKTDAPGRPQRGLHWFNSWFAALRSRLARENGLLADMDLADGIHLLQEHKAETESDLVAFIEKSAAADRRIRSRSVRILAAVTAVVTILAVIALVAGFLAQRREREAEYQRDQVLRAQLRLLIDSIAQALRDYDVRTAENISLEVLSHAEEVGPPTPEMISAFEEARAHDMQIALLFGHSGVVNSAAFSPDGTQIVTGSDDGTVRVWDSASGIELKSLSSGHGSVRFVALSRDGTRVVAAMKNTSAEIWDVREGKVVGELAGHTGPVNSAAFSPDGSTVVTGSDDGTAWIWDATTLKPRRVLAGHTGPLLSVVYSPDGARILTASADMTARIWDASSGKQQLLLSGHTERVWSAAYSPNGKQVVTVSQDKTGRLWDAAKGTQSRLLYGSLGGVHSVAFSPDGKRIVTGSDDQVARIWDAATATQVGVLSGHLGKVLAATYSSDSNRIVTASADMSARVWFAMPVDEVGVLVGHSDIVTSARYAPDRIHAVTSSSDHTARVWDVRTFTQIGKLSGHTGEVNSVEYSPDGTRIVTASYDKTVRIWNSTTFQQIAVLPAQTESVTSATYSPDGRFIATSSFDRTARIWDAVTLAPRFVLSGHRETVRSVAYSPDGTHIVSASDDKTAYVWDATDGKRLLVLSGHGDNVRSARYSFDGTRIVTASQDGTARIWDASSGKLLLRLVGHSYALRDAVYSPDGRYIATAAYDKTARIWDAETGKQLVVLPVHGDGNRSVSYAPDGKHILVASLDATASIWNADVPADFESQVVWLGAAQFDPLTDSERARFGIPSTHRLNSGPVNAGKDIIEKANALALAAHTDELASLYSSQPRRNDLLLEAFKDYTIACSLADKEGQMDDIGRRWRYRRATLARLLARAGMMQAVAATYRTQAQ